MTSFLASHQSFSLCWFMFVLVEPPSSVLIWKHKFDPLGVSGSLTIPANWSYPPNYHLAMSRCSIVSGQEWPVWLQVQFQGANSIFLCGTKDKVRVVRMLPCVCFTWKCAWQGARLVKVTIQVHTALWWWVAPVSLCCRSANVLQSWCSDRNLLAQELVQASTNCSLFPLAKVHVFLVRQYSQRQEYEGPPFELRVSSAITSYIIACCQICQKCFCQGFS